MVGLAVIEQVPNAVHRVLEQGGGGKDDDPHLWIHEWNRSKSGDEPGDFPDEAGIFERFHGVSRLDVNGWG